MPETLDTETTCDVSNEVLKSFVGLRSRKNRSVSRDSLKSNCSEKESDDESFKESLIPVMTPHPSPVYEPEIDEIICEDQFKAHAFDLNVQLEVASTFDRVSSLSFQGDKEGVTRCISSFGENTSDDFHISPKIRRSSSPGLYLSTHHVSRRASLMVPYQRDNNQHAELRPYLSNGVKTSKGQKPRKRSWDSRCHNKTT